MTDGKKNAFADGLDLLPDWLKKLILNNDKGLAILLHNTAVKMGASAARSKFGKAGADGKHAAWKENKVAARAHYEANKAEYASKTYPNTYAAGDLAALFPGPSVKTYQNWVSQWSRE
jgi:hypothetical protein